MAISIGPSDLTPFAVIDTAKAIAMIDDALARAEQVAPCITEPDFPYGSAAKAVIRGAILRWNEAGSGSVSTETIGPYQFGVDTRQPSRSLFWPAEIVELQTLCRRYKNDQAGGVLPKGHMPPSPLEDPSYRAAFGIR